MKKSEKGRYIRFEVDVWYQPDDETIHIVSNDPEIVGFHSTVNDRLGSKRHHANLYMKLGKLLRDAGKLSPDLKPKAAP